MLYSHPEILMHNEVFNENCVHAYYKEDFQRHHWDYENRDVDPDGFVDFIYDDRHFSKETKPKAIGYKSFPNHYQQRSIPLATLEEVYLRRILEDPDVIKIILRRNNVLRTYVSLCRSFQTGMYMTASYQDCQIQIDVTKMQRFVDRYYACYETYWKQTRWHPRCVVSYEDLIRDDESLKNAMDKIWKLLGVCNMEPKALVECQPQSRIEAPLWDAIRNYEEVEFACRHDPELRQCFMSDYVINTGRNSLFDRVSRGIDLNSEVTPETNKWALLIPVRSGRDGSIQECADRLKRMYMSILTTSRPAPNAPLLLFGVDDDDDALSNGHLIRSICKDLPVQIEVFSGLQGKICKLWGLLAALAYKKHGAHFTCLLGDDVVVQTSHWQEKIENEFNAIARDESLPFGAACVAFVDESFRGLPSFPVVHKWHFETFGGSILPPSFTNQGGDPFLFELDKRLGAARFALDCSLVNTIGGKHSARYTKHSLRFEGEMLSSAISTLLKAIDKSMENGTKIQRSLSVKPRTCLDVVVPTYRCDIQKLRTITSLQASWPAQVSFWLVLDNPSHRNAPTVRDMQTVAQNYQVNVLEQFTATGIPRNVGASAARNFGMALSMADNVVLLDDDVEPDGNLLDAYLGAIMRWPDASVYVGSTKMPYPTNWLTHALVAGDMAGTYTVAERMRNPPWGVTANLCVKARTSRIRFDLSYPKTGGGEDLDYCARAARHGPIHAVPGANAFHPWWHDGEISAIPHILGWAKGEMQCATKPWFRQHTFFSMPNGAEILFLTVSVGISLTLLSCRFRMVFRLLLSCFAIFCLEMFWHASRIGDHRLRSPMKESLVRSTMVRLLAASIIMLQEGTRFWHVLHSPSCIFWRVDWHFGQSPDWVIYSKRSNFLRTLLYITLIYKIGMAG
jgi:glycosyltransferase involved in cell wall biosynthesis